MAYRIKVRHNFEMGHRLTSDASPKCQRVHGHSWWCTLTVTGEPDKTGMVIEFGKLKKAFRGFLDDNLDHRTLLNPLDPMLPMVPGAVSMPTEVDPTTENIARLIHDWAVEQLGPRYKYHIELWETQVNCATYGEL